MVLFGYADQSPITDCDLGVSDLSPWQQSSACQIHFTIECQSCQNSIEITSDLCPQVNIL